MATAQRDRAVLEATRAVVPKQTAPPSLTEALPLARFRRGLLPAISGQVSVGRQLEYARSVVRLR